MNSELEFLYVMVAAEKEYHTICIEEKENKLIELEKEMGISHPESMASRHRGQTIIRKAMQRELETGEIESFVEACRDAR